MPVQQCVGIRVGHQKAIVLKENNFFFLAAGFTDDVILQASRKITFSCGKFTCIFLCEKRNIYRNGYITSLSQINSR